MNMSEHISFTFIFTNQANKSILSAKIKTVEIQRHIYIWSRILKFHFLLAIIAQVH